MSNDNTDDENDTAAYRHEKTRTTYGTTVTITVEVAADGGLTDEERRILCDALLEEGMNTDCADWDDDHQVPTVRNEVV